MIFEVYHWTEYRYAESVSLSRHQLRMRLRAGNHQRVLSSRIEFLPRPLYVRERVDAFGNHVDEVFVEEAHKSFQIKCVSRVETLPRTLPMASDTAPWEKAVEALLEASDPDPRAFLYPSLHAPWSDAIREWTERSFPAGLPVLAGALDLSRRIFSDFTFDAEATTVSTPIAEVFEKRRGVCQDFAHFQIACLRSMGLAARYVSGYIRTEPPPGQTKLFGADASHAWVSFYCPGHGWIDIDPTNNRLVDSDYVVIGWGRDYADVSLIRGTLTGGGAHSLYLSVDVSPVDEGAVAANRG
ncbi:Transglutaminase-like enzyme, putative cysteine protease [Verrucomicrobium sp. GAS474]|uniref:transglutaminase family protein n=1 Tax=Verrucomicrobium sp. GAS474 TaxID=1882831 RepID=UPI00087BF5B7|nr:transglutaminase family protein [Verrucomicrobium sp. GAS474]SDU08112.1 Transglutaminase-like enzyme, putative cysteine protease [Verrucomicrobium sp. GAS474]